MKIKLDDEHTLVSDAFCLWIVKKEPTKSDTAKNETRAKRVSGYCMTFEQAVTSYIDHKINSSEADAVKQLRDEIKEIKRRVLKWCENAASELLKERR